MKIQFVSAKGRELGEAIIEDGARVPSMTHRVKGELSQFVAERQDVDEDGDPVWVYRRVGVERE